MKRVKVKIIQQKQDIVQIVAQKLEEKAQLMIDEVDRIFNTNTSISQSNLKS